MTWALGMLELVLLLVVASAGVAVWRLGKPAVRLRWDYKAVVFKGIGAVAHAVEPWPRAFLVSDFLLQDGCVEVQPLTVRSFLRLVVRNWATGAVWRFRRACWVIGFIDMDESKLSRAGYSGDWRLRWWLPRVGKVPPGRPLRRELCPVGHLWARPVDGEGLPCPDCLRPRPGTGSYQGIAVCGLNRWSDSNGVKWEADCRAKPSTWRRVSLVVDATGGAP